MPVRVVCPECGATTIFADDPTKKSVECLQCGKEVPVPSAKPAGPPPLPPMPKKEEPPPVPAVAAAGGFEVLEDDEVDDDRPPVGRDDDDDDDRPRSRSRYDDDEDEEDDDRPRSRARYHDDDEDDDEEESPRRSRARIDNDDDEDDEDARPRRSVAARGDEDDEDEDEEDDEQPRSRRAAILEADEDEDDDDDVVAAVADDDDDDDESPRSHIRRSIDDDDEDEHSKPKSGKGMLVLLAFLAFLMLGAGGGALAYYYWPKEEKKVVKDEGNHPPDGQLGAGDANVPVAKGPDEKLPDSKETNPKTPKTNIDPNIPEPPGLPITPVNFAGDRKTIPLPDKVKDSCACGDGRYVVLSCATQKKLLIYDVSAAAIAKEISTEGKSGPYTAGAHKLLVCDNTNRRIERYDLLRLEKDKDAPYPFEGKIDEISLGAGSDGPALVVTNPPGAWPVEFLDVETLGKADVGWKATPPADLPKSTRFSAAANGSRWAGIPAGANPRGAVVITREGKQISAELKANDTSFGYLALSADGQMLCSRLGVTNIGASVARAPAGDIPSFIAPAVSGQLFVHVLQFKNKESGNTGMRIALTTAGNTPSQKLPRVEVPQPYAPGDPMPPDRHIYYVPEAKSVVICPSATNGKMEIVKVDPATTLVPSTALVTSTPPDSFKAGSWFTYRVRTAVTTPNLRFGLQGPPEATVTANGLIAWKVPDDEKREVIPLKLTITGQGPVSTQSFVVYNSATPAPNSAPPPKSAGPKDGGTGVTSNTVPGAKLVQESSGRLPIAPPEMKDLHAEVALPGPIKDACVAGGGRYLIFHCASVKKLAVFDVNKLEITHTITVNSDEILFAASMEKLLVIYPDEKVVLRYSLASFKLETDINLEVRQRATAAAMGSATAGPLILGGIPAQNNASKMALTFLDVDTMKEIAIDKAEGDFKVTFGAAANLRASADGRTLGAWLTQLRPSGLQVARLSGNTIGGSYLADSVGHVTPGPDGQTIFTEKGMYTTKGEPTGKRESAVPAVQGNWFLTLAASMKGPSGAQRVSVWQMGMDAALAEFEDLPGFDGKRDPFDRDNPTLALDRRLFLVPDAKILIVVPPAANKLHVYRVEPGKK